MEAKYWYNEDGNIRCTLCPHLCLIHEGRHGICKVRKNSGGRLIAETWAKLAALHHDPVEKKPLYHFYPGSSILSVGSVGCNMRCKCCQNWQISQVSPAEYNFDRNYSPSEILTLALSRKDNLGVAYTYNEPGMWFEFMISTARLIHENNMKNVMVSNGYINEAPLNDLIECIDAFNIDLKGFTETFYKKFTGSSLAPVLHTLKQIRGSGRHLEITCLVIPNENDDRNVFNEMVNWIAGELGSETVLHLSRYHPAYKMGVEPTRAEDLEELLNIARNSLSYVYAGNIQIKDYDDTRCSKCGQVVIRRAGYYTDKIAITEHGTCRFCGNKVITA